MVSDGGRNCDGDRAMEALKNLDAKGGVWLFPMCCIDDKQKLLVAADLGYGKPSMQGYKNTFEPRM